MQRANRLPYPWIVLSVTCFAAFMTPFGSSVVNLALPAMGTSLRISLGYVIWIPTVYLLAIASLETTMGRVGDMKGRRMIFLSGVVLYTLGSVICGFSQDLNLLLTGRIVQGIGGAGIDAGGLSLVAGAFGTEGRGKALGIYSAVVYSGVTAGPLAGGFLVQDFGWRSIFFLNIPIGISALLLTLLFIKSDKKFQHGSRGFDVPGSATLALFLTALLLALSGGDLGFPQFTVTLFVLIFLASIIGFIVIETRVDSPLLDLHLFSQNRLFAGGALTAFMNYSTSASTLLILSIYLQTILRYSPLEAGLILLAQSVFQVISAPIAGTLSDRFSARILSSAGMISRSIGFIALSFLGTSSPASDVWIPLIIVGIGHGFFSSPNVNSVMDSVTPDKFGIASATLGTIRTGAQSVGIAILAGIIATQLPVGSQILFNSTSGVSTSLSLSLDFVSGLRLAFIAAAAISFVGALTSLLRGKKEEATTEEGQKVK